MGYIAWLRPGYAPLMERWFSVPRPPPFDLFGLSLPRGTEGSNPAPSSGESVSLPELLSRVGDPGFCPGNRETAETASSPEAAPLQPVRMRRDPYRKDHRQARSEARQHFLCGAGKFDDADGDATFHEAHKRILEEVRKSCAHGRALCALVQLRSHPQDAADLAGDGCRDRKSAMVDGGRGCADR